MHSEYKYFVRMTPGEHFFQSLAFLVFLLLTTLTFLLLTLIRPHLTIYKLSLNFSLTHIRNIEAY